MSNLNAGHSGLISFTIYYVLCITYHTLCYIDYTGRPRKNFLSEFFSRTYQNTNLGILGNSWQFFVNSGHFGPFLVILGKYGHFGQFWAFWAILLKNSERKFFLGRPVLSSWIIMWCLESNLVPNKTSRVPYRGQADHTWPPLDPP